MNDTEKFREDVYAVVASIPYGKVLTYGQIAWLVGRPRHSRMVGHVLQGAAAEIHLPCHRVVNSSGRTAPHWLEQTEMLKAEGVTFRKNGCVDMKACNWNLISECQEMPLSSARRNGESGMDLLK